MKNDLTTGAWQHDVGCPIKIFLVSTSDVPLLGDVKTIKIIILLSAIPLLLFVLNLPLLSVGLVQETSDSLLLL